MEVSQALSMFFLNFFKFFTTNNPFLYITIQVLPYNHHHHHPSLAQKVRRRGFVPFPRPMPPLASLAQNARQRGVILRTPPPPPLLKKQDGHLCHPSLAQNMRQRGQQGR